MAIANKVVTIGTSATEIHNADSGLTSGARVFVSNESGGDVFLGDDSVTTTNGFQLKTGGHIEIPMGPGEVLYGVASASDDVSVLVTED